MNTGETGGHCTVGVPDVVCVRYGGGDFPKRCDRGLCSPARTFAPQVGRNGLIFAALRGQTMGFDHLQLGAWAFISSPLWIGGAFVERHGRFWIWGAALLIDYAAPWFGQWLPRFGRRSLSDWSPVLENLAERNHLGITTSFVVGVISGAVLSLAGKLRSISHPRGTVIRVGAVTLVLPPTGVWAAAPCVSHCGVVKVTCAVP